MAQVESVQAEFGPALGHKTAKSETGTHSCEANQKKNSAALKTTRAIQWARQTYLLKKIPREPDLPLRLLFAPNRIFRDSPDGGVHVTAQNRKL